MKKIFVLILVCISLKSFAQYPGGKQTLGSDSNVIEPKGGLHARLLNWIYFDTTAANLQRVKQYPGAQIFTTSDNLFWLRNSTADAWLRQSFDSTSIYNFVNQKLTASDTAGLWQQQGRYEVHHTFIDSITCTTYSDSTVQCDTFRLTLSQENITNITNIINYLDSLRGPDTTALHKDISYGPLDMYVAYDPLGRVDTIHYALDSATLSRPGYMTRYQVSLLGTGGVTIDTTSLSNRIDTKQPQLNGTGFVKSTGTTISYDNSTYLTAEVDPKRLTTLGVTGTTTKTITATLADASTVTTTFSDLNTGVGLANNEEKSGSTSSTITLAHTYTSGTIKMFKNGVRMQAADFTEATGTTITLNVARLSYDFFTFDYQY